MIPQDFNFYANGYSQAEGEERERRREERELERERKRKRLEPGVLDGSIQDFNADSTHQASDNDVVYDYSQYRQDPVDRALNGHTDLHHF